MFLKCFRNVFAHSIWFITPSAPHSQSVLFTDLEGEVGVLVHSEHLGIVQDGQALDVLLVHVQPVLFWGDVDT